MSTGLDQDTMQSIQSGRETLGSMLRKAQKHLQKVFIIWVVGLVGTIYALSNFVWDAVKQQMIEGTEATIITITPFDVILLQVKIGAVVGILMALPLLIYYSRDTLRERGLWPSDRVPVWKLWGIGLISAALFIGGVVYSYELFFPLMFDFLAANADAAGFRPDYSIVKWFRFVALLGFSFGLAAQLPLMMSSLSYTGIVPYETFRDRWRVAVVLIFGFGALFSPPDPFTQVMWATPLVGLYVVSLGISKVLVLTKRAGEEVGARSVIRTRWNKLAAAALVAGAGVYYVIVSGTFQYVQAFAAWFPSNRLTGDIARPDFFGLGVESTALGIAVVFGLLAAVVVLYYYMVQALDVAAAEAGNYGDPTAIDIEPLSAGAVRAAPVERFEIMEESEALELAQSAMDDDDPEKAEAILDRWDFAQDTQEGQGTAGGEGASGDDAADSEEDTNVLTSTTAGVFNAFTEEETTEDDIGGYYYDIAFILDSLTSKAIWFVVIFGLVGGATFLFLYSGIPGATPGPMSDSGAVVAENGSVVAENVTLISDSVSVVRENRTRVADNAALLTRFGSGSASQQTALLQNDSQLLYNATVYNTTGLAGGSAATDGALVRENATVLLQNQTRIDTTSGIGIIKNAFVSKLPAQLQSDVTFITLHPVEHLIFIVKFSTILGAFAALPLLLYFAWPAMSSRGLVHGSRGVMGVWGGTLFASLIGGSLVGFLYVAPTVISWLAELALRNNMIISYRVAKFGWLVLGLTVGIGLLFEIPITMLLFHRGRIISFQTIQKRWRTVTLGVFAISAMVSPKGIFTMFLVAVPVTLFFLVGLGLLWLYTLGGRRTPDRVEPAD